MLNWKKKSNIRKSRRETVYKMLSKRGNGVVLCFCCHRAVALSDATLEHIKPLSKGGTDDMENLSISHEKCNILRGNKE